MRTILAYATMLLAIGLSMVTPAAICQNPERVKLNSVEALVSPPITDVESNVTINVSVKIIGKC